jgi:DNA-binding transcriptional MerR regulator
MNNSMKFSLTEVSEMTGVSKRNVRFYIQQGLVKRPNGAGRGAWYDREHLLQLAQIGEWQKAGLSLERIGELLRGNAERHPLPPRVRAGGIEVWTRLTLREGIELHLQPGLTGLSPAQVKRLRTRLLEAIAEVAPIEE